MRRVFAVPRERFPNYQDEELLDALDDIVDGLENVFADEYTDDHGSPSECISPSTCKTAPRRNRQEARLAASQAEGKLCIDPFMDDVAD